MDRSIMERERANDFPPPPPSLSLSLFFFVLESKEREREREFYVVVVSIIEYVRVAKLDTYEGAFKKKRENDVGENES